MVFTWNVVERPKQGQAVSGDRAVAYSYGADVLLAAVIDGLGGGSEAAHAAERAVAVLSAAPEKPLQELMRTAHDALHGTRGAVAAVLRLEPNSHSATYVGVGNIGTYVLSERSIKPISKSGILGYRLPLPLLELRYTYDAGDIFVLYSDGLDQRVGQTPIIRTQSAEQIAQALFTAHAKTSDDATVLVIKTT